MVDDSLIIRRALGSSLQNEHIVYTISSAQAAISMIDSEAIDLIIMNPLLAHNSGMELLYEIHSHTDLRHVMTILIAANPNYFRRYLQSLEKLNVRAIIPVARLSPQEIMYQVGALAYVQS